MKKLQINISADVEFSIDDENDLYFSIQVDQEDFVIEKLKFADIFRRMSRRLNKEDKKDFKEVITRSIKDFLTFLENN